MKKILCLGILLNFCAIVAGQEFKKVLGKPDIYRAPKDYQGEEYKDFINRKSSLSKEVPWQVISDRDDNETFQEANEGSASKTTLKFREVYYVVDENQNWLRIVELGRRPQNDLKIIAGTNIVDKGWIQKDKVLLWNNTLRNSQNGIHLKSLLLYSQGAIKEIIDGDLAKSVKFHSGPSSRYNVLDDRLLYEFFFVLKKENGFYLLASEPEVTYKNDNEIILGWIPATKQAPWNTRLSLEPNFNQRAFDERKKRKDFQVHCFKESQDARSYNNSGNLQEDRVSLTYDPVVADPKERGKDGTRFKGIKMRLPVLESQADYFSTGTLSSFDEKGNKVSDINIDLANRQLFQMKNASQKWNFLFLVEATETMRAWKASLKTALEEIRKQVKAEDDVRFAIAFYRDPNLSGTTPYFNILPRTNNLRDIYSFIDSQEFIAESPDRHTALNFALNEGLIKAGFGDGETNILYLFANNPDFSNSGLSRMKCNRCPELISINTIAEKIASRKVNFITINMNNTDSYLRQTLVDNIEDLMLESSKIVFESNRVLATLINKYIKFENPSSITENSGFTIRNSAYVAKFRGPETSSNLTTITKTELIETINGTFEDIKSQNDRSIEYLMRILQEGHSMDELDPSFGTYGNTIIDRLNEILKGSGLNINSNVMKSIQERKVRLYAQAYTAKKHPAASYELFSPVLFFPRQELLDYIQELENISILVNKPGIEMRRGLVEHLRELFSKYSGTKKVPKDLDLDAIRKALTGNGFEFKSEINFPIDKITNENLSEDLIRNFIEKLSKKKEKLKRIADNPESYEYIYIPHNNRGNSYYWIPFEDTF